MPIWEMLLIVIAVAAIFYVLLKLVLFAIKLVFKGIGLIFKIIVFIVLLAIVLVVVYALLVTFGPAAPAAAMLLL